MGGRADAGGAGRQGPGSWRRMLEARPVRNAAADVAEEEGALAITVRVRRPRWLVPPISWLVPIRPTRTVRLDPLGAEVWRLCDGERSVEEVADAFGQRHGLTFHEARVAVVDVLGRLVRRGVLAVAMPEEAAGGRG